jgi:bacterioferritin
LYAAVGEIDGDSGEGGVPSVCDLGVVRFARLNRMAHPLEATIREAYAAFGRGDVDGYNRSMRGNEKVLKDLGEALKAELTAINQYFLHAKMCENWGYFRLGAYYRKESIEEMVHAETLMERILFLEGTPNMSDIASIKVGTNVKAQFESDLALEMNAVKQLNGAIKVAAEVGDNASRELFEEILSDEEEHVDYLEGQLHAIGEMGIENYLAQQLHKGEEKS